MNEISIATTLPWLALILIIAKLGGDLAMRIGQPAVLGELAIGIVVGNAHLLGFHGLEALGHDPAIALLAELGVIILLFEVGLESTVGEMMKVGASSFVVAVVGVVTPMALGFGVGHLLLPQHSAYVHLFLGAALSATSVGITARVMKDLGKSQTAEARIVLGAAVIDDVLGLVVLAVVAGAIAAADRGGSLSLALVGLTLGKSVGFLVAAIGLGMLLAPRLFRVASHLKARGVLLAVGLGFCFLLSWGASFLGLAPIVGAFAAGLVLEDVHFQSFTERGEQAMHELLKPISSFLVPIFFVRMGARTDLASFLAPGAAALAAALTLSAILGKQACGLGVVQRGIRRVTVGIGMIPRGEVGLIFANIGLTLSVKGERIIDNATFSAIVVMVIVTTMVTPPLLKWSMARDARAASPGSG
ncbi:MAG: cation:proton antiporter [Myxococcota bacterium]